jgi:hypothetical protein
MVPKSSSNNHSLSMAKYFTDVAWIEAKLMGKRVIDFRVDENKISGGHFNESFELPDLDKGTDGFTFAKLVQKVGGTVPGTPAPTDHWLTIQTGYEGAQPKANVPLVANKSQNVSAPAVLQAPAKGMMNLGGLKSMGPSR